MRQHFILLSMLLAFYSCAKGAETQQSQEDPATIEMPAIPGELREPTERADYLIIHFWDKLDVNDTTVSHNRAILEQSFVNFLSVLPYASSDIVTETGFGNMLDKAAGDLYTFNIITETAEDYLFDPNSPMLSEDQYILYLTALSSNRSIGEVQRLRVADRLEMVSKNRPGTEAADFSYTTPDGKTSTLKKTLPEGDAQLMLVFFDPDCENCEEVLGRVKSNENVTEAVASGRMKILAVYSGENEESWRRKASSFPTTWTVGYDSNQDVDAGELYFLPAMPTIYILDSQGKVVEKDVRF